VQTYDGSLLVCGSANMNRRSFTCDMELDCAVMHPPTVRWHLAGLAQMITGQPWTDFSAGWLGNYWTQIQAHHQNTLIDDPFFTQAAAPLRTPNNIDISPDDAQVPEWLFEPSSVTTPVETDTAPTVAGDPGQAGRLDEVTFLLERHSQNGAWPYRR
jgi:phosphatidylserine/phosphatidylglycerophosphate/cardiolipin synthase-like enzyme